MYIDFFRVQVKDIDDPEISLFRTSNMPVLPKNGDSMYVEDDKGKNKKYVVVKKDWIVSDGNNSTCTVVIWVREPGLEN